MSGSRVARPFTGLVAGFVAGLVVIASCTSDPPPTSIAATTATTATTATVPATPSLDDTRDPAGPVVTVRPSVAAGLETTVPVERRMVSFEVSGIAPTGEVQLSLDPTFGDAAWVPARGPLSLEVDGDGERVVFARARRSVDGPVGPTAVTSVLVDRTWEAATASATGGPHRASWARLAARSVLQVRIEAGRTVWADGTGRMVVGRPLDVETLDDPGAVSIDDGAVEVRWTSRVSRPAGSADDPSDLPMVHDLFLGLAVPLTLREPHRITFRDGIVEDLVVTIDPESTPSPSIHVNQVGYRPHDDGKTAFVSAWGGAGIALPDHMAFTVRRADDGQVVLVGGTTERLTVDEIGRGDLTGTDVHEADLGPLREPGRYRLCVRDLGCSDEIVIAADSTWRRAAVTVARAMYHQRSGTSLGPPWTPVERPLAFHPDRGTRAWRTLLTMLDDPDAVGRDDRFDAAEPFIGGEEAPDVWGGHFDAGDWNSRIQHLHYLSVALDLIDRHPDVFASLDLQIPESGDAVPDLVDEGLWDLELYRRLQHADGGVPGAVDQTRPPGPGTTSWTSGLDLMVYDPDEWSTYIYADAAARAATVLERYDPARAGVYRDSALRAMAWAEDAWAGRDERDALSAAVEGARGAAAASLLGLTGDRRWAEVFRDAVPLEAPLDDFSCESARCTALWRYASLPDGVTDPAIRAVAVRTFVEAADRVVAAQDSTAFRWAVENTLAPLTWGTGPSVARAFTLLRAFELTGDLRYRTAAVQAASFTLGANPMNVSFVTGLGAHPVRYPFITDVSNSALPAWPGTPVYGLYDLTASERDDWIEDGVLRPAGILPDPLAVPFLWSWYDIDRIPPMGEFTVFQNHAAALWTFGELAAG